MSTFNGHIKIYDSGHSVKADEAFSASMDLSALQGLTNGTQYSGDIGFYYTPPSSGPINAVGTLKIYKPGGGAPVLTQQQSVTIDLSVINWLTNGAQYWVDFFGWSYTPEQVPGVALMTEAAADSAITAANLVVGTDASASSSTVPSGSVISQSPSAGAIANIGDPVTLTISTGPPQVAVPNVVGLAEADADTAITNAGLVVGTDVTSSSSTVPSGSVISESPAAGTMVNAGSSVVETISTGSPTGIPSMPSSPPSFVTNCPTLAFSDQFNEGQANFNSSLSSNAPIVAPVKWGTHKADGQDWWQASPIASSSTGV